MPEQVPPSPSEPQPEPPASQQEPVIPFHIGEEFGTASKNLPPAKIVLIGLVTIVVIAVIISVVERPHANATGSIDDIAFVDIPNQDSVMIAINLSLQNQGKKPFWIRNIRVDVDTGDGTYTDEAAPAVDAERYFQIFPALKQHARDLLKRETMLNPGEGTQGTIVVSFPITTDRFTNRKSLKVTIRPYDQPVPLVLTK